MKAKIQVVIDVEYETNGAAVVTLKDKLFYAVRTAYDAGHFESGTGAEIEEMTISVDYIP